jgi:hypothetical protein
MQESMHDGVHAWSYPTIVSKDDMFNYLCFLCTGRCFSGFNGNMALGCTSIIWVISNVRNSGFNSVAEFALSVDEVDVVWHPI